MNQLQRIDVKITLLGPILTQGNEPTEPGIDAPMARDALGKFMLPYSLVKGKIRDALCDLRILDVSSWFGQESAAGGFDPDRGRLRFSDFITDATPSTALNHDGVIERVEINRVQLIPQHGFKLPPPGLRVDSSALSSVGGS